MALPKNLKFMMYYNRWQNIEIVLYYNIPTGLFIEIIIIEYSNCMHFYVHLVRMSSVYCLVCKPRWTLCTVKKKLCENYVSRKLWTVTIIWWWSFIIIIHNSDQFTDWHWFDNDFVQIFCLINLNRTNRQ